VTLCGEGGGRRASGRKESARAPGHYRSRPYESVAAPQHHSLLYLAGVPKLAPWCPHRHPRTGIQRSPRFDAPSLLTLSVRSERMARQPLKQATRVIVVNAAERRPHAQTAVPNVIIVDSAQGQRDAARSSPPGSTQGDGVWTTAASARRKAKVWTCAECAKAHKERSAVRQKGGGYVCLERCGLVEGARSRKEKRAREAGE
jgi:hypothetical protein